MARDFDGSDDNIINDNIPITVLPLTFFGWFNSDTITANQVVFGFAEGSSTGGTFISLRGGDVGDPVSSRLRTNRSAESTTGYSADTWHSMVGTMLDDDNRSAFIDGGSKGSNTVNAQIETNDRVNIGRLMRSSPADSFNGEIAHCAGYNVELSDNEVAILARGVNPFVVRNDALKVYYPLDGNDSPEPEYVGQLSGTITGAVKGATNPPVELVENYL